MLFYLHIKLTPSVYAARVALALSFIFLQISYFGLADFLGEGGLAGKGLVIYRLSRSLAKSGRLA